MFSIIKISVIVPVYNVEDYLERCLKSLASQSLKEIEIIIVNDGSTDDSQKIIDKYTKKYPKKIRAYSKENGGLSDARNYGIDRAKGKYISFVDSDDWVDKFMLEKMYQKAIKGFDVIMCDLKYTYDDCSKDFVVKSGIKEDLFCKKNIRKSMINIYPVVWNKIYKKELFDYGIRFKKNVWYEDVEFLYKILPSIKSIGKISESMINYYQRENAITKTYNEKLEDYILNLNSIVEFYKEENIYSNYKKELEYIYIRYLYGTMIKNALNIKDINKFKKILKHAIENVNIKFRKYKCNKYFYKSLKGLYLLLFNYEFILFIYYIKKSILHLKGRRK